MRTVQIMAYAPLHSPDVSKVPATLGLMQEIVGGLVEVFDVDLGGKAYQVFVHEDAEARGRPANRKVGGRMLYGTFVVAKFDGQSFGSLSTKEALKIWDLIDKQN